VLKRCTKLGLLKATPRRRARARGLRGCEEGLVAEGRGGDEVEEDGEQEEEDGGERHGGRVDDGDEGVRGATKIEL
jgi:hypothetical protein